MKIILHNKTFEWRYEIKISCMTLRPGRLAGDSPAINLYRKLSAHMTVGLVTYPLNRSFNLLQSYKTVVGCGQTPPDLRICNKYC